MHVARRFEQLLDTYRRPDGRRWTGQQLDEATGGVVPRSYVTNLRKGRIESPGLEKMRAIAKAMGFPPAAWFEEDVGRLTAGPPSEDRGVAGRVERLFDAARKPGSGEPYANAEVARAVMLPASKRACPATSTRSRARKGANSTRGWGLRYWRTATDRLHSGGW